MFTRRAVHHSFRVGPAVVFAIAMVLFITQSPGARSAASAVAEETESRTPDASLVVRFDNLARELRSPAGESLRATLDDLGLFGRTTTSWNALAGALGLEPGEAIDTLLSGRFLLLAGLPSGVGNGTGKAADRWACVMSIEPTAAKRIAKSLNAAPRSAEGSRTIYAIEDGRLRIVPLAGWTRVAVATPDANDLLRAAETMSSAWTDTAAPPTRDSPIGVVVYKPADAAWLSGSVHEAPTDDDSDAGWTLRFTATEPHSNAASSPRDEPTAINPSWFDAATTNAAIAYAGPLRSGDEATSEGVRLPFVLGPFGNDLQNLRKWTGVFLPFDPPPGMIRGGADHTIMISGPQRAGSVWFRVDDAAQAAKVGDAHVCDLVGVLAGAGAVKADDPECTGQFPIAARRVDLSEADIRRQDLGGLGFAWGTARVSVMGQAGPPDSWWSMHSVPEAQRPPSLAPGLSADQDAPTIRFTLRPELLVDRLEGSGGLAGIITAATTFSTQDSTPSSTRTSSNASTTGLDKGSAGLSGLGRIALIDLQMTESVPTPQEEASTSTGSLTLRFRLPTR